MKTAPNDTKKVFWKMGSCSRTFCYLLNRKFGHQMDTEERAADPLAGGIMLRGHQCGMLWGAVLSAGAEAQRRYGDRGQAIAAAISGARRIAMSFEQRAKSTRCRDITGCDMTNPLGMTRYIIGIFLHGVVNSRCFNLAEAWTQESIDAAKIGLSTIPDGTSSEPQSCASLVVEKMGGSACEQVMVAGFAGGIGLSGNGCGALGAAIWMKTLRWCRQHPDTTPPMFQNQPGAGTLKAFCAETASEFQCEKLCGRKFASINDHSEHLKNGGCGRLIDVLATA